jgi:hypothetical protein
LNLGSAEEFFTMEVCKPNGLWSTANDWVENDIASLAQHMRQCERALGCVPRLQSAAEAVRIKMGAHIVTSACLGGAVGTSLVMQIGTPSAEICGLGVRDTALPWHSLGMPDRASMMDFVAFSVVINLLVVITASIPIP